MNFEQVIDRVASFLEGHDASCFLIGGLAMHAYGSSRLTSDVDLLTEASIREQLVTFMENDGYETLHASTGFSNHLHRDQEWGRVDFVYTSRDTVTRIAAAASRTIQVGARKISVPSPEHLVAMKVLAMKNEPRRTLAEMSDIQHLMSLPETDLSRVREYFEKHGLLRRYDEIREVAF